MIYKICFAAMGLTAACSPVPAPNSADTAIGAVVSQSTQKETTMSTPVSNVGNTARNGQIAIKEEFDAAMKANTKPALDMFIKRHPNSQWTPAAKTQRNALGKAKK